MSMGLSGFQNTIDQTGRQSIIQNRKENVNQTFTFDKDDSESEAIGAETILNDS